MYKKIALVILLLTSCDDDVGLRRYCENRAPCWIPKGSENNEKNIIFDFDVENFDGRDGYCNAGYTVCEDENVRCEGIRYPEEEICDGIDNNCNGVVDDPTMFWAGIANTKCYFEEVGECRYSEQHCLDGELVCLHQTSPFYGEEVCDNRDNDCDGEYDEDVPQSFVYIGPYETVNVGECKAGITVCEDGQEKVFGMVLPKNEICSNAKDDDCDGLVDEREVGIASVDYAFYIDFSGSMLGDRLDNVVRSVCSFVDNPIFAGSRFAMIGISVNGIAEIANVDPYGIHVISDFTDIATACGALMDVIDQYVYSASEELQLDAVLRGFGTDGDTLSWSDNQRKVYIFSDEPPQCRQEDVLIEKIDEVIESCNVNNFTVGVFTLPEFYIFGWEMLVSGCGGFMENIDRLANQTYFEENFLAWFGSSC